MSMLRTLTIAACLAATLAPPASAQRVRETIADTRRGERPAPREVRNERGERTVTSSSDAASPLAATAPQGAQTTSTIVIVDAVIAPRVEQELHPKPARLPGASAQPPAGAHSTAPAQPGFWARLWARPAPGTLSAQGSEPPSSQRP